MKLELLNLLRCPETGQTLKLEQESVHTGYEAAEEINSGWLVTEDMRYRYPICNGIPRFVPEENYADNFGMQWKLFRETQLDSHSGHPISANRFWRSTGWKPEELKGQLVLDVGCGSGRFAQIALSAGAKVVGLDYSGAVDACFANLGNHPNMHVVQGDIYHLPLKKEFFDFVYCLGVLQHTPDVRAAFHALPPMLGSGGKLVADVYQKSLWRLILPKYWLRPLTTRLSRQRLFHLLERSVPSLLRLSNALGNIPSIGPFLKRFVPVANYTGSYPLSSGQLKEWALLDTFDWLAPAYDQPQTARSIRLWSEEANLNDIEVLKAGHLVIRATR